VTEAAYEALAAEYDAPEHSTTRRLERLSNALVRSWLEENYASYDASTNRLRVLEVGCGTGSLTEVMVETIGAISTIVAIDQSAAMIAVAGKRLNAKLGKASELRLLQQSVYSVGKRHGLAMFDLVIGGLVDPFLEPEALRCMVGAMHSGSRLVLTTPHRHWADWERRTRLHVAPTRTSFRLRDGSTVMPLSFTYLEEDLPALLGHAGLALHESRTLSAPAVVEEGGAGLCVPPRVLLIAAAAARAP
jgi:SAM-dependent methyltransferase